MANREQLARLLQGIEGWNKWREEHPHQKANLTRAEVAGADLAGANLAKANLTKAELMDAFLVKAALPGADLAEAYLPDANLTGATLAGADLTKADLTEANLREADLSGANLSRAILVDTHLEKADLAGCHVYGIAAWDVHLQGAKQTGLVITLEGPEITVDDLEVAQFIYLLLNNEKVRTVIDTVTSKVVLILGRFADERKAVLDALRYRLRTRDLSPVLFDFSKPASKDVTGTVETLARMARFIVADLTDSSSIPHELATVVPFLRTTPVVLLRLVGTTGYSMVKDLEAYAGWVIPVREYSDSAALIDHLDDYGIQPAEAKLTVLRPNNPAQ